MCLLELWIKLFSNKRPFAGILKNERDKRKQYNKSDFSQYSLIHKNNNSNQLVRIDVNHIN